LADVFAMPSTGEGFGLVFLEAIADGTIALLTQQGSAWWFERQALHQAVTQRFGRAAFPDRLRTIFS
jgi:hypothetical protein